MQKAIIILSILLGYLLTISAQGVKIGNNTNAADASAMLDVESTNKGLLVPRMTESQRDAIGSPATGLLVFQTDITPGFYYWDGTVWQALGAVSSGSPPLAIGDNAHGGIVFYIFQSGDPGYVSGEEHGLVCALADQSSGSEWGCYGISISGADGTALGTGAQNTFDILAAGCTPLGIAAELCDAYSITYNGTVYDDWFLPSKDELDLMYQSRTTINATVLANGGSSLASGYNNYYWSSTEIDGNQAWIQRFYNGNQYDLSKYGSEYVRAVRAF
jgi:hypothetical protein